MVVSIRRAFMLQGERVTLRALERSDLERCYRWINDEDVTRYLYVHGPMSMAQEEQWLEGQRDDDRSLPLAIVDENGRHIGNIGLDSIDYRNGCATIGILIGEKDMWGKGYGTEAMLLLLTYAFDHLRLHRVNSAALAENARSIRMHEKCGFVREGVRRQVIFRFGRWIDVVLFGILAEEFKEG
jgi:RimJ/RimL family protein N-acetyltransferase